jgi:hypothetical protein
VGPDAWASAPTLAEALEQAGNPKSYRVFLAAPGVTVTEDGQITGGDVRLVAEHKAPGRGGRRKAKEAPAEAAPTQE